jgi:hypothetical protein
MGTLTSCKEIKKALNNAGITGADVTSFKIENGKEYIINFVPKRSNLFISFLVDDFTKIGVLELFDAVTEKQMLFRDYNNDTEKLKVWDLIIEKLKYAYIVGGCQNSSLTKFNQ